MEDRSYNKCKKCNTFHWTTSECPESYEVFHEDYLGDDAKTIHADSHYDAALKYAEYYNDYNDHSLLDETIEVTIKKGDEVQKFKLSAEHSIDYFADEIE